MCALPDNLTATEKEVVDAVSAGRAWSNPNGIPTSEDLEDEDFVAKMPEVRAEVIRALCLGARLNDAKPDPAGVRISGARIVGKLDLSFATVDVRLSLRDCHFADEPNFMQAKLAFLNLSGSRLEKGLRADRVKVAGSLFCQDGFHADGEIRLLGAEIGGDVTFIAARLNNPGEDVLSADGVKIAGDLFCRNGFNADGEIRLLGAEVGGDVSFSGASLKNPDKRALTADRVKTAGSLFCDDGFSINGTASFIGSLTGKRFYWKPTQWTGQLGLSYAHARQWADNWRGDGWKNDDTPVDGEPDLDIDAFAYDALAGKGTDKDAASRIAWVRKSQAERKFVPGPYEILAKALRAAGDEDGANEVAYAKRADRAKARKHKLGRRISDFLLGAVVGYGYKPWRGLAWLIGLLITGFCVFSLAGPMAEGGTGAIKPAVPIVFDNNLARCEADVWHPGQACKTFIDKIEPLETHRIYYFLPIEYTPFSPFWYALDTLIPLVDLGQETAWSPSPIDQSVFKDPWGWAVLIYLYAHIIMGWLLTTLTVVALTGVIKKE
ncbi:MAG TPA: hypothetical protein PKZ97_00600 [Azospirillaceae bacterium]|nr:hypothetical protein [Azospirillaceae bacterium]HRQ79594.1 hypothetical protein [Azospirillaceae bacterium]